MSSPKKLIRTKVIDLLKPNEYEIEQNTDELNRLFQLKTLEELSEILNSEHRDIYEFADLIQVAFSYAQANGFTHKQVMTALSDKQRDKGVYEGTVLTNLNPHNPSNSIYFELAETT